MTLDRLGVRQVTMDAALRLLETRGGLNIVETGCARLPDNWGGDGLSSVVFGEWARDHQGHLWTVDIDPHNLDVCRGLTEGLPITYVHDDSVHYLTEHAEPVDLLYLDSFDYPLVDLLTLYGWQGEDFTEHVERLKAMGDDFLAKEHDDIVGDCQRHCANEVRVANITDNTIVLIDDANLPGGGKARQARWVLEAMGWTCLMDEYQTLWVKA